MKNLYKQLKLSMPKIILQSIVIALVVISHSAIAATKSTVEIKAVAAKFHSMCRDENQKPYIRARACIEEVKLTHGRRLELANMKIDKIPDEVFNLKFLTSLDVNHTNVDSLPRKILRLKKLKSLSLTYNKFTFVPKVVFQLPKLVLLEMIGNHIAKIEKIKNINKYPVFQKLRYLDLSLNPLREFPSVLLHLKNVKELFFGDTKIKDLPKNFGMLKSLRTLNLSENYITSLPKSIGDLTYLDALVLNHNRLIELPKTFGKLKKLSDLDLSHNQLRSLPESFGRLSALRHLDLSHNLFTKFPEPVTKLSGLTELMYGPTTKHYFSKNMKNMLSLNFLHLYGEDYKSIPDFVFDLPHLTGLVIGVKETLERIPKEQIKLLNRKGVVVTPATKLKLTDPNAWKF